jgi:hypothetical protein
LNEGCAIDLKTTDALMFLFTAFPLEWHLKTALNRLMFETWGFFIILFPIFYKLSEFFLIIRNEKVNLHDISSATLHTGSLTFP